MFDNLNFKTPSAILNFDFKHAYAATTQPNIYDGNYETLFADIIQNTKKASDSRIEFWVKKGAHYSFVDKKGQKWCSVYFGKDRQNEVNYLGFRLNDDDSVRYAFVVLKNINTASLSHDNMIPLAEMMFSIGISYREYVDLWSQLLDFIEYAKDNNISLDNQTKTFYKTCNSINKNVYMKVYFEKSNDDLGVHFTIGATN